MVSVWNLLRPPNIPDVRLFTVDIPPSQVNILNGTATDLVAECNAYEKRIKSYGGIELFLSGIGEDGHIAFNVAKSCLFCFYIPSDRLDHTTGTWSDPCTKVLSRQ